MTRTRIPRSLTELGATTGYVETEQGTREVVLPADSSATTGRAYRDWFYQVHKSYIRSSQRSLRSTTYWVMVIVAFAGGVAFCNQLTASRFVESGAGWITWGAILVIISGAALVGWVFHRDRQTSDLMLRSVNYFSEQMSEDED